ncbi:hypothetical protein LJC03_05185 [Methanobrevibacter sp. OttesenSCG-928-I08]|nr:hypothetical protein [Methanobrevibacter sp. OttesenSCG-928-I08]
MKDYNIYDVKNVLDSIKENPYGIKETPHYGLQAKKRSIDFNIINEKLLDNIPVSTQKTAYYSNRFELIYEYSKNQDLYIAIDIINNNEIMVITVILKSIKRRVH